jgi:hypothetical protein
MMLSLEQQMVKLASPSEPRLHHLSLWLQTPRQTSSSNGPSNAEALHMTNAPSTSYGFNSRRGN